MLTMLACKAVPGTDVSFMIYMSFPIACKGQARLQTTTCTQDQIRGLFTQSFLAFFQMPYNSKLHCKHLACVHMS